MENLAGEVEGLTVAVSDHSSKKEDIGVTQQLQKAGDDSDVEGDADLTELLPVSKYKLKKMQSRLNRLNSKQEIEEKKRNQERKEEKRRRKKKHLSKQYKMHMEAVQNIRNTITVVAVLIATIAFTGAVTPPGSVYQDGPLIGKPILGRTTSYKVFIICNDIALFLSLSVVLMLISIIPFQSKPLMKLVFIAHKVVWAAVAFMSTAYIAARWATMYHAIGTRWMFAVLVSICGGLLILVFFGLSVMLVNDRLRKSKWKSRMETMRTVEQEDNTYNIISDVESNLGRGSKNRMETMRTVEQEDDTFSIISDVESNLGRGYHSH